METVLEMQKSQTDDGLGELPTFVGLPSKRSSHELSADAEDLFKRIVSILNNFLLRAIDQQTSEEFVAARDEIFVNVAKTHRALGSLASVMVPRQTLNRLAWESFAEMEAELTEQGLKRFGATARDQAIFTVWTLRKMHRLLLRIVDGKKLEGELADKDREIAKEFNFFAFWSLFHLECLIASMRFNKPVRPEVLETICGGLRAAVNAYGFLRQGLELRMPAREDEPLKPYEWDEEDEELLASSMADMEEAESEDW